MTEAEWASCREPLAMLAFLRNAGKLSDRKARLFAVACCRRVWSVVADPRSRHAVELAERSADEPIRDEELDAASGEAEEAFEDALTDDSGMSVDADAPGPGAAIAASYASNPGLDADSLGVVLEGAWCASSVGVIREKDAQANILRDLFGPVLFRPVILPPSVQTRHDGTVTRLARAAYDNRRLPAGILESERLMVLADALEEAGSTDMDILGHLREQGAVHVRGCWCLDAILGRK